MIYFVRHGESEANSRGVFAGQKDDAILTLVGREQAKTTAEVIKTTIPKVDKIITSSLKRTYETAVIIAEDIGFDVDKIIIDDRIAEYDMGSLTGTPIKNISSITLTTAENAENPEEFYKRIQSFFKEASLLQNNVLVVSSAGVGRMLEIIKSGGNPKLFYDLPAYKNASITKINWFDL